VFETVEKVRKIAKDLEKCIETFENIGKYSTIFYPPCAFD